MSRQFDRTASKTAYCWRWRRPFAPVGSAPSPAASRTSRQRAVGEQRRWLSTVIWVLTMVCRGTTTTHWPRQTTTDRVIRYRSSSIQGYLNRLAGVSVPHRAPTADDALLCDNSAMEKLTNTIHHNGAFYHWGPVIFHSRLSQNFVTRRQCKPYALC